MEGLNMRQHVVKFWSLLVLFAFSTSVLGNGLKELEVPGSTISDVRWESSRKWNVWSVKCPSDHYLLTKTNLVAEAKCVTGKSDLLPKRPLLVSAPTKSKLDEAMIEHAKYFDLRWDALNGQCWFVLVVQCKPGYEVKLSNNYTLGNLVDGHWKNIPKCVPKGSGNGKSTLGTGQLPVEPGHRRLCRPGCENPLPICLKG